VNIRMRVRNEPAVVIPNAAVQFGAQGNFVYVIDGENKAKLRNVKLGVTEGERVAVLDGVNAGDRVVLEGLDRLRDDSEVIIVGDRVEEPPVAAK